jgi:signal transduction histidine kinase
VEGNVLALLRATEERARFAERTRLYRMLHDNVLPTLTAVARGTVSDDRLRARCAADADLIRDLISADARADPAPPAGLPAELTGVIRDQRALGLRVHARFGSVPEELPAAVIAALAGACREALNNVIKHAGTGEAWLTAIGIAGAVTVTVVDRGRGMPAVRAGSGLRQSIGARMAAAGGKSTVDSEAGEGTCVELSWPR